MSILIKGMEMPTNCCQCPVNMEVCKRGYKYLLAHPELYDKRADDCPLIEVPPHGRLIDADALRLLYDFNGYKPTGDMTEEEFDRLMCRLPVIRANIDDAPTIIESTIGQLNSDSAVNEANANTSNAFNALEQENKEGKEEVTDRNVGKWMYKKITNELHVIGQCSVCKERRIIDNFCSNCGADMRCLCLIQDTP